jgi:ribosomal protein S18 acetylase RimI-like enzyme
MTAGAALLEVMEENLHAHVAYVQSRLFGMFVDDREDLLLVDSGLASDTFNKIARARLDEDAAVRRIAEAVAHFRAAARPFAWWIGPCSRPAGLAALLENQGLRAGESELGMAADLSSLPETFPLPAGLDIRRVRTDAELFDFAAVQAANWDPPDPSVLEFFARAAPVVLEKDCSMQFFVGYVGGIAVSASELFLTQDAAGIHMVSTRAAFRRRGIGCAMTWAAADEGRRQGAVTAMLQASGEGRPVYARLGFEACCEFTEYL